jgi:hypothetical protein
MLASRFVAILQKLIETHGRPLASSMRALFLPAMPAKPLASDKVAVKLQNPEQDADFFLIGFPSQIEAAQMNAIVRQVEAQGKVCLRKSYMAIM